MRTLFDARFALMSAVMLVGSVLCQQANAGDKIVLAETPAVSPNGKQIAFAYNGDLWLASIQGGAARRITNDPAVEAEPHFSPNGRQLAFLSTRKGGAHAYVMDLKDLEPKQVGFHSEGYRLHGWTNNGRQLIASGRRDGHWRWAERFFYLNLEGESPETPWFDAFGSDGSLARDGRNLLFVREGERWWRQGYVGSRAAQIWRFDRKSSEYEKVVQRDFDCRWPMWRPDGKAFYYVGGDHDGFDLWLQTVHPKTKAPEGEPKKIADMGHGSIVYPALSGNGRALVFRHLGDLYSLFPTAENPTPTKLELHVSGDVPSSDRIRRTLTRAGEIEFTADLLEMAFTAGGDVWAMDTVLREPVQITDSPHDESNLIFDKGQKRLYMARVVDGQSDIWFAERVEPKKAWWQNTEFKFTQVTDTKEVETYLRLSPDGKNLLYVRGRGELWVQPVPPGSGFSISQLVKSNAKPKRIVEGFDRPDFEMSPDSKWIAYSHSDDNFNRDVWIVPVDGSKPAFNVSRHPDDDYSPRWSPDGKLLAFLGRRATDSETDIYYVYLQESEEDVSSRDRKLSSAMAKMKSRGGASRTTAKKRDIQFEGLHDRIHKVSIPDASESGLRWSADAKRLAFTATIKGKRAIYTISPPLSTTPATLSTSSGSIVGWTKAGTLLLNVSGVPTAISSKGATASYSFSAKQEYSRSERYLAAFDACWQTMRDHWYDPRVGNRNWDEVYRTYSKIAQAAPNPLALKTAVELMLGELNGSHLGFTPAVAPRRVSGWFDTTPHLGIRFDHSHQGPGLKVRDVITGGPADREGQPKPGDIVRQIDGKDVDPGMDLAKLLNGDSKRDIRLTIEPSVLPKLKVDPKKPMPPWEGHESEVNPRSELTIRPTSFSTARTRLYSMWLEHNRKEVERLSDGKLGYLHILAMDSSSFTEFERQLYYVGFGKEGLVIDVRENGGGSTADHLLTALTQPDHAVTVPRGGGPGYPQSRRIYATWNKPIIVMCNHNSYSNAEIFSHAIKGLGRGRLVGTPTAGGVISTGRVSILDVGALRFPFRGWFVKWTGEDMELNGAVPDVVIWPEPGEMPKGIDRQLEKAVEMLKEDVKKWKAQPRPKLKWATQR